MAKNHPAEPNPRLGRDKKIHINAAALVDLKAALFRKQQEYRKEKGGQDSGAEETRRVSDKTASIWRTAPTAKGNKKRRRDGVGSGGEKEDAKDGRGGARLSAEEEAELAKSRQALEAKAALYERLCRGEGLREVEEEEGEEGEGEGRYMVDFTRKVANELSERGVLRSVAATSDEPGTVGGAREAGGREGSRGEGTEEAKNSDDEWVDYVDSLGRSRRCLKKDLPHVMGLDQQLRKSRSPTPDLLSDDMRRERERRRWEEEQAQLDADLDKPVGPVHYQNLQQGEIRSHGVGYYAFSTDEEKRQEQMNLLNQLKEQTAQQREKRQKLQQKRKAKLEARLAKVRQRKLKQGGGGEEDGGRGGEDIADFDFEGKKEEEVEAVTAVDISARIDEELARVRERVEEEKRQAHVRPWDRGKVKDPIRKRKQELEDERLPDFAPPSSYSTHRQAKKAKQEIPQEEKSEPNEMPPTNCESGSVENGAEPLNHPTSPSSTAAPPLASNAYPGPYPPHSIPPPHGQFAPVPPGYFFTQPQPPPPPGDFSTHPPPPPPGDFSSNPLPHPGCFSTQPPPLPGHFVTHPPPPPPGQYLFRPPPPPGKFVPYPPPSDGQFASRPHPPGALFPPPPVAHSSHTPYVYPPTSYSSVPWQPTQSTATQNQNPPNSS